jgi:hypothetical protein
VVVRGEFAPADGFLAGAAVYQRPAPDSTAVLPPVTPDEDRADPRRCAQPPNLTTQTTCAKAGS